jgi:gliding motility-associated-like protein
LSLDAQPANLANYRWTPTDDLSADNVPNPSVNTSQAFSRTYTVTGTDANGCTNTASVAVEVRNVGFDLTIDPPGPLVLCVDGPPVQLRAMGAAAVTFRWAPATDLSADNIANPTLTPRTPTATGISRIYTLVATDANGCESQAELEVKVIDRLSVAAVAEPVLICAGNSATLNATGARTYAWQPGNLTGTPLTVSPTQTTTYTLTGTDENGCSNTAEVTVTVADPPVVNATADPNSLCAGGQTRLAAAGADSYTWEPGTLAGASVDATVNQTTTFTVTGTNASGCSATAAVTVTVVQEMTFDANAPRMVCAGSTVTLPLLNVPSGSTPVLASMPANGITLRLVGAAVEVQANAPGTYRISASAPAGGCPNLAEIELVVRETPVVLVSTDGGITELCVGQPLLLSASGADRYSWSPMTDLSNATATGDAILFTPTQAGVVTFRVLGAKDDPNFPGLPCSAEATLTLTVRPAPDFSRLERNVETCVNQPVKLGVGVADDPGTTYRWTPANLLSDAQIRQPELRSPDAGTFDYSVSATLAACTATAAVTVTVHPAPTVAIVPAEPADIKTGTPLTLTAAGADTYRWEPTANLIGPSDGERITLAHDEAGTYRYTVTGRESRFGCTNTASVSVVVVPVRSMNVITPNGDNINDVFYYDADPAIYRTIVTRVFDRSGLRLFEGNAFGEANGWRGTDRNGKEVPAGAYHFVVELERLDGKRLTRTGTVTLLR